jgi:putative glycosyltransferase (TIGR04372 family)
VSVAQAVRNISFTLYAKAKHLASVLKHVLPRKAASAVRLVVHRVLGRHYTSLGDWMIAGTRNLGLWRADAVPFRPLSGAERQEIAAASDDTLRSFNLRAFEALNRVDIDECVRNALPAATIAYRGIDLPRLQIKEAANYCLAVALHQGLGRLDEAILVWRERQRLAAEIVDRLISDGRSPPRDPETQIFDTFWSSHIGHTALLGIHAKQNLMRTQPRRLVLLRKPEPNLGNRCLVDHWERYFQVAGDARELPVPAEALSYVQKFLYLHERPNGQETYFWQAYAEISRAWDASGRGSILELSGQERRRGREALAAMGLPPTAWYVCLHVRSSGFKPVHEGLQDTLSADISTYERAIDAIVERGGWVIRMGDPSMPPLPGRERVIDYAHGPFKKDWLDVFLCATCWFYVGTSSGLGYVPNLFGVPSVFTNWFPTGTRPLHGSDIFIPKLHWYDYQQTLAPFDESLAPPLGHIHAKPTLRKLGVSVRDNNSEDLFDVVTEMLDRLEAKAEYSVEDRRLQACFDTVALRSRSFGNARIGRDFIRKYRGLLPSGMRADPATAAQESAGRAA